MLIISGSLLFCFLPSSCVNDVLQFGKSYVCAACPFFLGHIVQRMCLTLQLLSSTQQLPDSLLHTFCVSFCPCRNFIMLIFSVHAHQSVLVESVLLRCSKTKGKEYDVCCTDCKTPRSKFRIHDVAQKILTFSWRTDATLSCIASTGFKRLRPFKPFSFFLFHFRKKVANVFTLPTEPWRLQALSSSVRWRAGLPITASGQRGSIFLTLSIFHSAGPFWMVHIRRVKQSPAHWNKLQVYK